MKKILLFLLPILIGFSLNASHYAGGNIYYDCLGNNQYRFWGEITLDCGGASNPTTMNITAV
ncbi:MAG: hypothetical protein ACPGVD_03765, partial [Flavobacteriales bacterium]